MKLIGLIGGVSPESTEVYYRLLNGFAKERLGGDHSARLLIWSFDFNLINTAYRDADWQAYRAHVVEAGIALKNAGVDALMICSNTTHLAAEAVKAATGLPLIHLLDALAAAIKREGVVAPLLLGTPFVMGDGFYRSELKARLGVETIVPDADGQEIVRRVIFDELIYGEIKPQSRTDYLAVIERGKAAGADGVILGCTEIGLLLSQSDIDMPAVDTTIIHARAASDFAFADNAPDAPDAPDAEAR